MAGTARPTRTPRRGVKPGTRFPQTPREPRAPSAAGCSSALPVASRRVPGSRSRWLPARRPPHARRGLSCRFLRCRPVRRFPVFHFVRSAAANLLLAVPFTSEIPASPRSPEPLALGRHVAPGAWPGSLAARPRLRARRVQAPRVHSGSAPQTVPQPRHQRTVQERSFSPRRNSGVHCGVERPLPRRPAVTQVWICTCHETPGGPGSWHPPSPWASAPHVDVCWRAHTHPTPRVLLPSQCFSGAPRAPQTTPCQADAGQACRPPGTCLQRCLRPHLRRFL